MAEEKDLIELLIEAGNKIIVPERRDNWSSYVNSTKGNIDSLHNVTLALGFIMALDNGADMDYAVKAFSEKECPMDDTTVRSLVANYSLRGPEFFEKTATEPIPSGNINHLEKLKLENERIILATKLKKDGYDVTYTLDGPIIATKEDKEYNITLTRKKDE